MQSSLARTVPRANATPHEMQRLRERAWRETRIAVIPVDDVADDWTRQVIINEANKRYGKAST
jgi:hypothetical protein